MSDDSGKKRKKYSRIDWENKAAVASWYASEHGARKERLAKILAKLDETSTSDMVTWIKTQFKITDDSWAKWHLTKAKILKKHGIIT